MGTLLVETDGGVGWLTFNRPEKHNSISLDMWGRLAEVLDRWANDSTIRVAILTGAGDKAFMAGADIGEFEKQRDSSTAYADYERFALLGRNALADFPKPLIAAVNGYCIGAGLGIAMASDLVVAADTATFAMPGAKLGMPCDLAMGRKMVSIVGPLNASLLLFSGERIPASEALRIGLINEIHPHQELKAKASRLAQAIAGNAPLALHALKRIVNAASEPPSPAIERSIRQDVLACADSEDYRVGRAAVLKKIKPQFQGR